jgi:phage-related protein
MEWDIEYYETSAGNSPVFEWIEDMPGDEQALALGYIDQLALLGLEAQRPLVRQIEGKLYELRWKAKNKQQRIAYYAVSGRTFVLLHGFTKKQNTTPQKEKNVALNRMKDHQRRPKGSS